MNLGAALLLGLLQGLTEFLPVSSSGHLALVQMLIPGFHQPGVLFDAMLHVGTASAVVWFERRQIVALAPLADRPPHARCCWWSARWPPRSLAFPLRGRRRGGVHQAAVGRRRS